MTTAAVQDRVDELFADARNVHAQAIERLQNGDIRDAAEKAWCSTKRATDALIIARYRIPKELFLNVRFRCPAGRQSNLRLQNP